VTIRVLILGSTGSIGVQALEVIAANPDRFEVVGVGAGGGNLDLLRKQVADLGLLAGRVAVADESAGRDLVAGIGAGVHVGADAMVDLIDAADADVVLNGIVGSIGLAPSLAALRSGARLALANKESLVAGGALVLDAAAPGQIVPVDSEHSARCRGWC
jgi:1-deoxy-D-xylulose-5-phosphate reductoisomerase